MRVLVRAVLCALSLTAGLAFAAPQSPLKVSLEEVLNRAGTMGKADRGLGAGALIVEYKEMATPAIIRGEAGRNLMSHGRVWIDGLAGRVLKTELQVEQPLIRAPYRPFHSRSSSSATACLGFFCSSCSSAAIPSFERPALNWIFASVT